MYVLLYLSMCTLMATVVQIFVTVVKKCVVDGVEAFQNTSNDFGCRLVETNCGTRFTTNVRDTR